MKIIIRYKYKRSGYAVYNRVLDVGLRGTGPWRRQRDYIEEELARGWRRDGAIAALLVVVIPHGWVKGILAFKLVRIGGGITVITRCNDELQGSDRAWFLLQMIQCVFCLIEFILMVSAMQ